MRKQADLNLRDMEREILDRISELSVSMARLEERILTKDDFHDEAAHFVSKSEHEKLEKKINILVFTGVVGTGAVAAADNIPALSKLLISLIGG